MSAMGVLASALSALAQAPKPAEKVARPAPAAAAPAAKPANQALLGQVLATVNDEKITRGDMIDFLSRYEIPPGNEEQVYHDAADTLINMRLISQFLNRQKIPVSEERVSEAVGQLEKQLKADGSSLAQALIDSNKSMAEVRSEFANRVRWIDFVKLRGTDAELKKFADTHKDLLSGTQVKASHILRKLDPKATAAEKQAAKQKLVSLKADIAAKKITFAEAANKFSEDPANSENGGGDIGYFGLNSGIVEEFGTVAFSLKPGQLSDPIETPYGYHLILVTDRKEGPKVDFEQNKPGILNAFAADLQKELLVAQRKSAKIDIKPMPPELFAALPSSSLPPAVPANAPPGATPKNAAPKR